MSFHSLIAGGIYRKALTETLSNIFHNLAWLNQETPKAFLSHSTLHAYNRLYVSQKLLKVCTQMKQTQLFNKKKKKIDWCTILPVSYKNYWGNTFCIILRQNKTYLINVITAKLCKNDFWREVDAQYMSIYSWNEHVGSQYINVLSADSVKP